MNKTDMHHSPAASYIHKLGLGDTMFLAVLTAFMLVYAFYFIRRLSRLKKEGKSPKKSEVFTAIYGAVIYVMAIIFYFFIK